MSKRANGQLRKGARPPSRAASLPERRSQSVPHRLHAHHPTAAPPAHHTHHRPLFSHAFACLLAYLLAFSPVLFSLTHSLIRAPLSLASPETSFFLTLTGTARESTCPARPRHILDGLPTTDEMFQGLPIYYLQSNFGNFFHRSSPYCAS